MDKATPTPSPASVESVMAKAMMLVGALGDSCEAATSLPFLEAVTALRAEVERLAAQAAPTEHAIKCERRAIEYGDIVHHQVIAMRAAVVAAKLESPEDGMQWIANTLFGPGHYPDIEAARELGGAQALFDKEVAEHEVFRAAHPAPAAAQSPAQAPVVQAGEYPPLPVPTGQVVTLDMVDGRKARVIRAIDPHWMVGADGKTLFTEEQMRAYVDADRASRAPAVRMLTREELNDVALSDQVGWEPGEYIEAVQRKFCAVNAGRAIPPDGKIGCV